MMKSALNSQIYYLVENYVTNDSKFPLSMWADEKRTNNAVDSYLAHLNEQFYSPYPTIFVFMDVVQKLLSVSYVKMRGSDTSSYKTHRAGEVSVSDETV